MVARLEGKAARTRHRVASITIDNDAVHRDRTGLRVFSSLPVRVAG
jgi:hypothetical protein